MFKTSISGFLSFEGDTIAVDNVTQYESVSEEEELGSRTGLSVTDGSSEIDVCDNVLLYCGGTINGFIRLCCWHPVYKPVSVRLSFCKSSTQWEWLTACTPS